MRARIGLSLAIFANSVSACGGAAEAPLPEFNSGACAQVQAEVCMTPEGMPRALSPDDEMFAVCGGLNESYTGRTLNMAGRAVSTFEYRADGKLERIVGECGDVEPFLMSFEYDDLGQMTHFDRSGVNYGEYREPFTKANYDITYEDGIPVLRQDTYEDSEVLGHDVLLLYDDQGMLARWVWQELIDDPTAGRTYEHDDQGRARRWVVPSSETWTTTFSWDTDHITTIDMEYVTASVNGSGTHTLEWEGDQLVEHVIAWNNGLTTITRAEYDDQGRMIRRATEGADGEPMFVAFRDYDDQGRLATFEWWGYRNPQDYGSDRW